MPQPPVGAAVPHMQGSEWEIFRTLITHDDRNSYYVVSSDASGSWEDTAVKSESLPAMGFNTKSAYYMTHNGFTSACRKSEQVRQLNALFFDLDCHDQGLRETRAIVSQTLSTLKHAVADGVLPQPTMTIDSGRGVQLFYVLTRSIPYRVNANGQVNIKSVKLFENVQKRMASLLDSVISPIQGISVDRATFDVSRVSRIPGTYNAKAGRFATLCDYSLDALYSLSGLSSFASAHAAEPIRSNNLKRAFKKTASVLNYQPMMNSRLAKITELQKLRNFNCEGNRELMSFVFYNTAVQVYPHEIAQRKLIDFNNAFINPLNQSELDGIIKSVDSVTNLRGEQGYYLIGANRLRELLGMTLEEEMAINFFESKRSVLRKEAKRITKAKREQRNARIVALFRQGSHTYASIAKQVVCSVRTVAAVISSYKQTQRQPVLVSTTRYNKKVLAACNFLSYEFKKCLLPTSLPFLPFLVTPSFLSLFRFPMTKTLPTSVFVTRWEGFILAVCRYFHTMRLIE
ncbi:hypothetical protein [uncultured Senegalimassilia sp.]|uniref:hypothetical protein n=1 Tax=uncultured Senegalimassilia sp. TaxID=1714350 RepID=UPI0025EE6362|nr:hypothetical protein [uncultured Senegalimassilia sp.]